VADSVRQIRLFVSSPADARFERSRLERVAERLNGEFQGVARLIPVRWETEFYRAHQTFQAQILEAARCEIVVAIFRGRLGTALPADFPRMSDGDPYPSGTAYEVLTAIDASKAHGFPDVYVFRFPQPPSVQLDNPERAEIETQWQHLKAFFDNWFKTPQGEFKAAFQTFRSTDDFEAQAEALLRKWLEEKVLHGSSLTWPAEVKGSPFRGLAAFGAKHAPVFFGRSRDITKAVDRLKDAAEKGCSFLLVDGASGAGKSSLVRAGLVPRLTAAGVVPSIDLWRVAVMRPAEVLGDPFASLARALFVVESDLPEAEQGRPPGLPELSESDFPRPDDLAALLAHADTSAIKPIFSTLTAIEQTAREKEGYDRAIKANVLLVVDQLDELFGADIGNETRAHFARLLGLLARSGRVWVIATLRADLFDRFLAQGDLKQLKEDGASYDLAPPDAADLAEIVRAPAAAAGLVYENDAETGERLDERLLKDAERADLLPLLQFTLNQLFEAREHLDQGSQLTFAAYRALGGLEGAVEKEAEAAFARLGATEQAQLSRLLRELVAPAGGGTLAAAHAGFDIRSVALAEAAYDEPSARLVQALVDARVLLSAGEGRQSTVRLAHARVLDSWQRASRIVTENADFYRVRAEVEEQRRRWETAGRRRDLLIGRGLPLAEAESIVRRFSGELPAATREFVRRSGQRARLSQTVTLVIAGIFAVVAVAAFVGWQRAGEAAQQARNERDRSLRSQSNFLVNLANQRIQEGNMGTAMLLALQALPDMRSRTERPLIHAAEAALFKAYQELQERIVLKGHESSLWSASFTPDGRRVVTASEDGTVRVWDVGSGDQLAIFQGHTGSVRVAAFNPDGSQLITASTDETARLWNVKTQRATILKHRAVVRSAAFDPDGRRVVTASDDDTARVWDAQTGDRIAVLMGHTAPVRVAAFSPNGRYVLTASDDTTAHLWDAETGNVIHIFEGHTESVRGAAFSPDGAYAVTTSLEDHSARVWDVEIGKQVAVLEHRHDVWSAAFSPNGQYIVTASDDKTARVWDAQKGTQIHVLNGHDGPVRAAVFSPDGRSIVTASEDNTARIWHADSGKLATILRGHLEPVRGAVFSPDGRYVLTISKDATARLWSAKTETSKQVAVLEGHIGPVRSAVFSPDGRRVLSASDDNTTRLWNAEIGQQIAAFTTHSARQGAIAFSRDGRLVAIPDDTTVVVRDADTANDTGKEYPVLRGHSAGVRSAAFSPDGKRIVTASADKTARVWDAEAGKTVAVLEGHAGEVWSAVFNPDGLRVVTTSGDSTARIWDAQTGDQIAVLTGHTARVRVAAFSPNGRYILTASDDSAAILWNAVSGELIRRFEGHRAQVLNATFSPDGRRIVTAGIDGTARLWDAETGKQLAILKGSDESLFSAAFSSDGGRIVTASADKTARVWDAEAGKAIAVLEGHAGEVWSAVFSPDGERVLTASKDNTARIWRVFPTAQALVDRSKVVVPRCLTLEEREDAFLDREPPAWCIERKKWPY
jgi:WD40 repeat protein